MNYYQFKLTLVARIIEINLNKYATKAKTVPQNAQI
jgi:hypothetical protein